MDNVTLIIGRKELRHMKDIFAKLLASDMALRDFRIDYETLEEERADNISIYGTLAQTDELETDFARMKKSQE